ncbi:MAG: sulfotransferase domain-containing protein [Thermodesulfobacteriota bacterium]
MDTETALLKKSPLANIYHCCTHKSGSQWLKAIFNDDIIYTHTGLKQYEYMVDMKDGEDPRKGTERFFDSPFPDKTIGSPMYITYDSYRKIPKTGEHRGVFILRDPRDLVVSWYFSLRYSHAKSGGVGAHRDNLNSMEFIEGLKDALRSLMDFGIVEAQRTWVNACDDTVLVSKYEDLIGPESGVFFKEIFTHCKIDLPDDELSGLTDRYSFEKMSGGRRPGEEDREKHLRKGISGDWKNYFSESVKDEFKEKTTDLLITLGYERDMNW